MAHFLCSRSRSASSTKFFAFPTLLLAGAALLAVGCHPGVTDPKDPKFIVAEKGNWHILRGELDVAVDSLLKQHQATREQIGSGRDAEGGTGRARPHGGDQVDAG